MDYNVSDDLVGFVDPEFRPAPPRAAEPLSFSDLERSVIHLSRNDPVSSIPGLRNWRVFVARLSGAGRTNALANDRLEELRRFAILVRVHDDPGDDALDRFLDAGYTVEQAGHIQAVVNDGKPVRRPNRLDLALLIVPLLAVLGVCTAQNDSVKIAIVLAIGGFISTIISFQWLRR